MMDNSKTSCRASLVIFVDTIGFNIFQKFNGIKEAVGFERLLQKYTGLIFYESNPRIASGLYGSDIPPVDDPKKYKDSLENAIRVNNPDLYKITLENAIQRMLAALTDESIIETLKNSGYDVQPEPQVFIVGSSNAIAPDLALKTVHEVLARPDLSTTRTQVYYILSGPPMSTRSLTIGEKKEDPRLNSNQQGKVNFTYLYPFTSKQTQEKAFHAAASALFTLINTGITSQSSFQQLIQSSAQKKGILRTSFLTFPGREMKSYCVNQLTSDLLDKWMPEETVVAALQDMKNMPKSDPSPDATSNESVPPVTLTNASPMPKESLTWELQRVIPDHLFADNFETRTFDKFFTFKGIHNLYKNSNSTEAWTVFLARKSEEKLNTWKQDPKKSVETTKVWVLPEIVNQIILPIWKHPPGNQRIQFAQVCIDVLKQQLAAISKNDNASTANANLDQQNERDLKTLEKQVEQAMLHMPSPSTLIVAAIFALVVFSFLILIQTSSLTGTLVLLIGIPIALPAVGFLLWHLRRIRKAQKQLIEQTRQEIIRKAEEFKNERTNQFIEALSNDLSDCLKQNRNWLESKREQFKQEADKKLEDLCRTLAESSHLYVCDHKLLVKNELDSKILREYYEGQIRTRINISESDTTQKGGDQSLTQFSLYTRLFKLFYSLRSEEKGRKEAPEDEGELSTHLLNFATSIFDEVQGKGPDGLKNVPVELKVALEERRVWEQLLDSLLKFPVADSSTLPFVFICGCGPDMEAIRKRIQEINVYKQLVVVPLRTRIIYEYWFFIAALFCDGST